MLTCNDLFPVFPGILKTQMTWCLKWAGAPKSATDEAGLAGCGAAFAQMEGWSAGDWLATEQMQDGKKCKYPVQILIGNEDYSVFSTLASTIMGAMPF